MNTARTRENGSAAAQGASPDTRAKKIAKKTIERGLERPGLARGPERAKTRGKKRLMAIGTDVERARGAQRETESKAPASPAAESPHRRPRAQRTRAPSRSPRSTKTPSPSSSTRRRTAAGAAPASCDKNARGTAADNPRTGRDAAAEYPRGYSVDGSRRRRGDDLEILSRGRAPRDPDVRSGFVAEISTECWRLRASPPIVRGRGRDATAATTWIVRGRTAARSRGSENARVRPASKNTRVARRG